MDARNRLIAIAVGSVAVVGLAVLARSLSDRPRLFAGVIVVGVVVVWGVVVVVQYLVNRGSDGD